MGSYISSLVSSELNFYGIYDAPYCVFKAFVLFYFYKKQHNNSLFV